MGYSNLSLTDHQWTNVPLDPAREDEIGRLVDTFYAAIQKDSLLGPVFEAEIDNWDEHLLKMRDFWTSAIYKTGRYSGRPFDAHKKLSGLSTQHFARWVELWMDVVDRVVVTEVKEDLKLFATKMAMALSTRLGLVPPCGK